MMINIMTLLSNPPTYVVPMRAYPKHV
jgi:hypothetical protein